MIGAKQGTSKGANRLILGCVQLGLQYGIANVSGKPDRKTAFEILDMAYRNGIRTLDTAAAYGESQQIIGDYLAANPDQDDWMIVSKLSTGDFQQDSQNHSLTAMLGRQPDLLLAHSRLDSSKKIESYLKCCELYPESGKGVSVYDADELDFALKHFTPDVVQLPCNLFDQSLLRDGTVDRLAERKIEVHVRSVFLQGVMFLSENEFANRFPNSVGDRSKFVELAKRNEVNLAELALSFAASLANVDKIIVGAELPEQLALPLDCIDRKLDFDTMRMIQEIKCVDLSLMDPRKW